MRLCKSSTRLWMLQDEFINTFERTLISFEAWSEWTGHLYRCSTTGDNASWLSLSCTSSWSNDNYTYLRIRSAPLESRGLSSGRMKHPDFQNWHIIVSHLERSYNNIHVLSLNKPNWHWTITMATKYGGPGELNHSREEIHVNLWTVLSQNASNLGLSNHIGG